MMMLSLAVTLPAVNCPSGPSWPEVTYWSIEALCFTVFFTVSMVTVGRQLLRGIFGP